MLVVTSLTLGLVHGLTFLGSFALADQRGVAEPDGFFKGHLSVFDEAALLEVLLALLLLLGLKVGGVGGVASLRVAMVALDLLVVFGLLDHDDLINTSLTGGGNASDIQSDLVSLALTGCTSRGGFYHGMGVLPIVMMMVFMVSMGSSTSSLVALVEGEGVHQRLGSTLSGHGDRGDEGGITLSDILALLLLNGLAINDIILDLMLVVTSLTLGLVHGLTFLGSFALADQRGVAEPDGFFKGHLSVFDEAALLEVLLALLLLLGLKVGGVGGMASLRVAMVALDLLVVFGLLDHDNLVNTSLTGGGNASDIQSDLVSLALTGCTSRGGFYHGMGVLPIVMMMVIMVSMSSSTGSLVALVEGEGVNQRLGSTLSGHGDRGDEGQQANL
ncbi:hypothetical protein TCAL_16519 [Tigriopus californicus]|uniref:Uncharacterized protein n=1 Tax=Tigriopus californicus TaxID=6832 RepID=A0A553NS50_TIGCA|nr:hypothetical protein TCAL_16519 [Tigriopus californicus]